MRRETRRLQAEDPSTLTGRGLHPLPGRQPASSSPTTTTSKKEWADRLEHARTRAARQYLPTHVRITLTVIDERGQEVVYSTDARIQMTEKVGYRPVPVMTGRRFAAAQAARAARERGVAMLVVLTWLALMISLVSEFTYGTTVDAAQAANARDELRAHYLARSSVNLSRLLIKIQQHFVDPSMGQAKQMLPQAMGGGEIAARRRGRRPPAAWARSAFSLRVTDYAGPLMGFFSGSKEEVAGLGSLIGIDTANIKGLGLKSGSFDAEITSEDGKIDINCGSGVASRSQTSQLIVYRLLMGLMYSRRFDRLFSEADATGQFVTRPEVARAIIDWADADDQMFSPEGASGRRGLPLRRPRRSLPRPRQQLRQHRRDEDGARRLRRLHGGVRAPPDGLRVRSRTARSTSAPSATRTAATARRC